MAIKYTISINAGEYVQGVYDNREDAEKALLQNISDYLTPEEYQQATEDSDALFDLADGHANYVTELFVPDEEPETVDVVIKTAVDDDYRTSQKLVIDDVEVYTVVDLSDCPEDAIIGRDLVSAEELLYYVQNHGEKLVGKKVTVIKKDVSSEELFGW